MFKEIGYEEPYYSTKISVFLLYLGWSGCFTQSKHNIRKVVQSYCQKCNNSIGVDLNVFKVLGHTWDPVGSPRGKSSISTNILHQPQIYTDLALWRVINCCKESLRVISL